MLQESDRTARLKPIAADLAHLFTSWFNRGFLVLRRIDWRTSAVILEKLIQYEAVHQIQGWHDLRRRLETDRRCYAFFHPALPDEPIIFIEVALTRGLSDKVQALLDPDSPVLDADVGRVGHLLLDHQLPGGSARRAVRQFPDQAGGGGREQGIPAHQEVRNAFAGSRFSEMAVREGRGPPGQSQARALRRRRREARQPAMDGGCGPARRVAAVPGAAGRVLPSARQARTRSRWIRWRASISRTARAWSASTGSETRPLSGLQRSAGLTANYVYKLPDVERNHELYVREHKVRASREIEALAKRFSPPARF